MKSTTLYFSILLILIILVSLYFKASNRENFTAKFDPSIINSDIPNGSALSNSHAIALLNDLSRQLSGININKINIVAYPPTTTTYITPPINENPNVVTPIKNFQTNKRIPIGADSLVGADRIESFQTPVLKGQTQLLLNGQPIPGIPTVAALIQTLSDLILTLTLNAQSIDIHYTTSQR